MDACSIMNTVGIKRLLFVALMFTVCSEAFAQEKKSSYLNFSVGAGWNNKTLLSDGDVFGGGMNGFYANLGLDFTLKTIPLGFGVSLGFQADFYSGKDIIQTYGLLPASEITIKQNHSLLLLPAEIHLFYLVNIPNTKMKIYPFVGIGKEVALSWKYKERSTYMVQNEKKTETTSFQLLNGSLPIGDLQGNPILSVNTMPKEDNAPLYWHVGARIDLTSLFGLKYSYQHNIGSKNYFHKGTFYQHSLGVLFFFDLNRKRQ